MKQLVILLSLAVAPAGWNALQHHPVWTGIGITLFSGLFIFSVMTAHRPWKIPALVRDILNLACVLLIFAATAVVLIALADDGLTVVDVLRILVNVYR